LSKSALIFALLAAAVALSLLIGPGALTADVFQIRLNRVILGIFAGGILGFCGAVLQGLFNNPLVEPYTLGSASGAALGAALGIVTIGFLNPLFAFAGSLGVSLLVFAVARGRHGMLRDRLILAGVIMSFLCSSLVMIIMVMSGKELYEILYLLMGYLGAVFNPAQRITAIAALSLSLLIVFYLYRHHRELDIISQGTETASGLGVDIRKMSRNLFFATALLTGLIVSLVGAIGFVGLIIPHLAKLLFGPKHLRNLPASFVLGAAFLLLADTLSRTITVYELPVGVVTSLIGVPFFIYLYAKK
jgi:iron complex transport system permease protein